MLRFFSGLALLILAITLELFLSSAGIYLNFILAALIGLAFSFDFSSLLVYVLFSVFILNWQPAPSIEMFAIAIVPILAYLSSGERYGGELWLGNLVALTGGFSLFYILIAPHTISSNLSLFLIDLAAGLAVGEAVFVALNY